VDAVRADHEVGAGLGAPGGAVVAHHHVVGGLRKVGHVGAGDHGVGRKRGQELAVQLRAVHQQQGDPEAFEERGPAAARQPSPVRGPEPTAALQGARATNRLTDTQGVEGVERVRPQRHTGADPTGSRGPLEDDRLPTDLP